MTGTPGSTAFRRDMASRHSSTRGRMQCGRVGKQVGRAFFVAKRAVGDGAALIMVIVRQSRRRRMKSRLMINSLLWVLSL